jgi:site-specific recombinase XerD
VRSETLPVERTTPLKAFPEDKFNFLVTFGFSNRTINSRNSNNLRNILITYLMHYGGLRLSEALSLWCNDVTIEAGEVIVRIYHPKNGLAPDGGMRSTYLDRQYGLQTRNTLVKSNDAQHLGWKDCLITDPDRRCFEVFFYPQETALEFAEMWRDYHLTQRAKPTSEQKHPYAFTTKDGLPYSHRMFRDSHRLAIKRLGLTYGKLQGTTPHGHRHAYGQRLAADGADALTIKFAMHHKSITSSQTYTQPTSTQMRHILLDLEARLRMKHPAIDSTGHDE